ncbi:unnamed protein product [Lota lota]
MSESPTNDSSVGGPHGVTGMNMSTGRDMKMFYTVNGNTVVTNEFTTKLKKKGLTEVTPQEQYDFILAFCPNGTRAGDIQETLDKCPGPADGKKVILVLLHHTFNPERCEIRDVGINGRDSNMVFVEFLFYDDRLLKCPHNKREFKKVLHAVGYQPKEGPFSNWTPKKVWSKMFNPERTSEQRNY